MSVDRQLFIGSGLGVSSPIPLLGTQNLDEANIIFWSPTTILNELNKHGSTIPKAVYIALQNRMSALAGWIERGHTLVVIGASSVPFRYDNSNVARNERLETTVPLAGVSFITATGTRVDYCGPPALEEVFSNQLVRFNYESLIAGEELVPLLRVAAATKGASQIVGGYRRLGLGLIVFIPPFNGNGSQNKEFLEKIAELPKLLSEAPSDLPDWVNAYQSASERQTSKQIISLEREAAKLQVQIADERKALESHRALKQLLGGTGAAFANAVASGLRELALHVVDGPHPRADLLSGLNTRFFAIEAKGIEGAVREAQFRQVERWTAEVNSTVGLPVEEVSKDPDLSRYAAQLAKLKIPFKGISEDCKGLMVIGTYRTTPLLDRSAPDFPEPVLRLLNRSTVCALTGAQLFALVMQVRENLALKSEIVSELIDTNGVLARGKNWSDYLERVS